MQLLFTLHKIHFNIFNKVIASKNLAIKLIVTLILSTVLSCFCTTPSHAGTGEINPKDKPWPIFIPGTNTQPPTLKSQPNKSDTHYKRDQFLLLKKVHRWLENGKYKYGVDSKEYANRLLGYARFSFDNGDLVAAISGYKEGLELFSNSECKNIEKSSECAHGLIQIYFLQHKFIKAEKIARKVCSLINKSDSQKKSILKDCLTDLAMSLYYQSKFAEAISVYTQLVASADPSLPSDQLTLAVLHYAAGERNFATKLYKDYKNARKENLSTFADNWINEWETKVDPSRVAKLAYDRRWTFSNPDFLTAFRSADWIALCKYKGAIDSKDLPIENFEVDFLYKGPNIKNNKLAIVNSKITDSSKKKLINLKLQCNESSGKNNSQIWNLGKDKRLKLDSRWIILRMNSTPLKQQVNKLYTRNSRVIKATKENLEEADNWYALQHATHFAISAKQSNE